MTLEEGTATDFRNSAKSVGKLRSCVVIYL